MGLNRIIRYTPCLQGMYKPTGKIRYTELQRQNEMSTIRMQNVILKNPHPFVRFFGRDPWISKEVT